MFWSRNQKADATGMELSEQCRSEAEAYFRTGTHNCAEAVLAVARKHFRPDLPDEIVRLASGFGGGSGSGCICGAVSGGTVALGLVVQDDRPRIAHLTRELHTWFKEKYGVTCCTTIRKTHKGACPVLTGEVAGKIVQLLCRK
jgi:C_GCAxxG_C_C family probable redox protein